MGRSQTPYSMPLTVALIGTLKGTPKHQGDPQGQGLLDFRIAGFGLGAWGGDGPLKGYDEGAIRVPLKGLEFPKMRGTLFWGPYNKDPPI